MKVKNATAAPKNYKYARLLIFTASVKLNHSIKKSRIKTGLKY